MRKNPTQPNRGNRFQRRESRQRTLPYLVEIRIASIPNLISCILKDKSKSGARIELESIEYLCHADLIEPSMYIWIHIPADQIWQEALVRWFDHQYIGVSFVGGPRRAPPDWVLGACKRDHAV